MPRLIEFRFWEGENYTFVICWPLFFGVTGEYFTLATLEVDDTTYSLLHADLSRVLRLEEEFAAVFRGFRAVYAGLGDQAFSDTPEGRMQALVARVRLAAREAHEAHPDLVRQYR